MDILSSGSSHAEFIKHVFAWSGPKSKPMRIEVNGRKGRRAICVVYGDGMRYEVIDMDAEEAEEEGEEGEEDETGSDT